MRFGATHRILTNVLAALGVLAIVSSGALPRISTILILVGLVAAFFATEHFQQSTAARYAAAVVPSTLLAIEVLRLIGGAPVLDLAVEFAAGLQIVRLATRRGAMHDQQVVLLALLHLVAGTVLGSGLAYGACLLGFLLLAPGALVLSHLRREVEGNYRQGARDRTGLPVDVPRILRSRRVIGPGFLALTSLLSLPILAFTALLFLLFPRVGLSLLVFNGHERGRLVGFGGSIDLGGVGAIRSDPSIAIRFRPDSDGGAPPNKMILRLRGTAFDEYRGNGQWSRSVNDPVKLPRSASDVPIARYPDEHTDTRLRLELEPLEPTVIFLPPRAVALRWAGGNDPSTQPPPRLTRTSEGTLAYEGGADRVLRYEVFSAPPSEAIDESLPMRDRARYLQLPVEMPPRVRTLAQSWTTGAHDDLERATMIAQHLENGFRYTLDAPSGGKPNPIDDFLFVSHAGHCEFFSTAMAVLLREVGVPTRNVSGFVGGTYNRFGAFYAVRQGDAHSWIEAYIETNDHRGWMTFDPTPSAGAQPIAEQRNGVSVVREIFEALSQGWDRYVVGYDLPMQVGLFQRFERGAEARREVAVEVARRAKQKLGGPTLVAFAAVLLVGGGFLGARWWRSRKARLEGPDAARAREVKTAAGQWQQVEEALAAHGINRPRNVPPLRFTEQLVLERGDAIAGEAHALAARYVLARFGGLVLGGDEAREFSRRVALLRKRAEPPTRASS